MLEETRGVCGDVVLVRVSGKNGVAQRVVHTVAGGVLRLMQWLGSHGVHAHCEVAEVRNLHLLFRNAEVVVVEVQLQRANAVPVAALLVQDDVILGLSSTREQTPSTHPCQIYGTCPQSRRSWAVGKA